MQGLSDVHRRRISCTRDTGALSVPSASCVDGQAERKLQQLDEALDATAEALADIVPKTSLLIDLAVVVLGAGSALGVMNNACKSSHHVWCAATSDIGTTQRQVAADVAST